MGEATVPQTLLPHLENGWQPPGFVVSSWWHNFYLLKSTWHKFLFLFSCLMVRNSGRVLVTNTCSNHQSKEAPAWAGLCIIPWILTAFLVGSVWLAHVSPKSLCSSKKQAEFALSFWHPGPWDHGGRMEKYLAVPPDSNFLWRHPPLADSESPTACLPSPAAHQPIRPAALLLCWLPLLAPTRVLKVEATLMREHEEAAAAGISPSASKTRPAATLPAGPVRPQGLCGPTAMQITPLTQDAPIPVFWSHPEDGEPYGLQAEPLEPKVTRATSLVRRKPWGLAPGPCPVYSRM